MQLPFDEYYDELVELIYRIPVEADAWTKFCKKIIQILDVTYVHIQALDFKYNVLSYSSGIGVEAPEKYAHAEMQYLHYPKTADPRWEDFLSIGSKGWYQCHHFVAEEFVQQSDLYQKILLPNGLRYVATHELLKDEKICAFWSVSSSAERKPLKRHELDFLSLFNKHLQRVVMIQRRIFEFSYAALVGCTVIDKLSQPILLLNLSGQVVHINPAAKTLLQKLPILQIEDQQLYLPEPYQRQLLNSLFHHEASFREERKISKQSMEHSYIRINNEQGEVLSIFMSFLASAQEQLMFGTRPLMMLSLYASNITNNMSHLYKVFDCLNKGVVLVNQNKQILYTNVSAEQQLAKKQLIYIDAHHQIKVDEHFQMRFEQLIMMAATATIQQHKNVDYTGTLALYNDETKRMLMVNALPISEIKLFDHQENMQGVVALFIIEPNRTKPLSLGFLYQMYNLNKAELQICNLFVQGLSLEHITDICDMNAAGLRIALKKIFEKTKTNSQTELMRLLMSVTVDVNLS